MIIWKRKVGGKHYEVRRAGRTHRLYTNGVCHSEYNPARVLTGSIWDLLLLPAFLHGPQAVRRALVLGVGGGSLLLQMRALTGTREIIGVDRDPVHLEVARRFYAADTDAFHLVEADARQWLRDYEGPGFDLIIDDLFTDERRCPVRTVNADPQWFRALLRYLDRDGTLVFNFGSKEELANCGYFRDARVRCRFASAYRISTLALDNIVAVFSRRESNTSTLRDHLRAQPLVARALRDRRLRYRIQSLAA